MARGRKKQNEISMLEAYRNEVTRLMLVEREAVKNLEKIREQIQIFKNKIAQEEHKELMSLIEEKGLTFDEVKDLISGIGKNENKEDCDQDNIAEENE